MGPRRGCQIAWSGPPTSAVSALHWAPQRGTKTMRQTPIDFDSMVNPANLGFVEDLYYQFSQDPSSVDPAWRAYFESLAGEGTAGAAPPPQSFSRSIFAHRNNAHRPQTAPATIKVSSAPPAPAHGSNGG